MNDNIMDCDRLETSRVTKIDAGGAPLISCGTKLAKPNRFLVSQIDDDDDDLADELLADDDELDADDDVAFAASRAVAPLRRPRPATPPHLIRFVASLARQHARDDVADLRRLERDTRRFAASRSGVKLGDEADVIDDVPADDDSDAALAARTKSAIQRQRVPHRQSTQPQKPSLVLVPGEGFLPSTDPRSFIWRKK